MEFQREKVILIDSIENITFDRNAAKSKQPFEFRFAVHEFMIELINDFLDHAVKISGLLGLRSVYKF